jgi:hypothetical protein
MELSLLEKRSIADLFKTYPTFYGTRRFIVVITRSRHWSALSQMNPVHSTASYSLRYVVILSYLRLGLPSGLFPSGFTTKTLYAAPHVCYLRCPYHHPWLGQSNYICRTQTFSCYLIGLVAMKFGLSFEAESTSCMFPKITEEDIRHSFSTTFDDAIGSCFRQSENVVQIKLEYGKYWKPWQCKFFPVFIMPRNEACIVVHQTNL